MKKFVLVSCLGGILLGFGATLDGLAAKVNQNVITMSEVISEMSRMTRDRTTPFAHAYSNALENAINRRLILQQAAEKKLDLQEWLVDNRVREIIKENFGGDRNKLTQVLMSSRTSLEDWRNQIREEMIINAMRYQMIEKNIVPSPQAMQSEYTFHRARYCTEAKTSARVILLRPNAETNTPSVAMRAKTILKALKEGQKFESLAVQYSSDSHAKDGGLWKDVKPEDVFRPEIVTALGKLKVGEHSQLINLDGWGFIVRKEDEKADHVLSFEEAYPAIERAVREVQSEKLYAEWMARLRAQAYIKIYPLPTDSL